MNPSIADYTTTLHQAFARHYMSGTDVWSSDMEMRCFPALIQGALKLDKTASALDIGCGAGYDTEYLSTIYGSATGIDLFPHPHWKELKATHGNADFIQVSFDQYETEERFNVILDNGCFHHQHPSAYFSFLEKVRALLYDNGCFALSTFKAEAVTAFYDDNGRLHKYFIDEELHCILASAGFKVIQETDIYRKKADNYYRLSLCKVL